MIFRNFFTLIRISFGLILLMIGIIGIFLPILQGWLFIFIAIPIISPTHGKRMIFKLKEWKGKIKNWRKSKTRN